MGGARAALRLAWGLLILAGAAAGWAGAGEEPTPPGGRVVYVLRADGAVSASMASALTDAIRRTDQENREALVIELDTPGGWLSSTRDILKEMLAAKRPVVVYVSPDGAHAGSAGAFITLAGHVAAMAPTTNIGASTPVLGTGTEMSKAMERKVVNDAAALMRTVAERHGRNAKVAEEWVREGTSKTATEALQNKVIDLIAPNLDDLLAAIDGKVVTTAAGKVTLRTKGARIQRLELSFRDVFLKLISNPNVAFVLLLLGAAGLYFEFSTPGAVLPGVVGGICLLLALYALQFLPVNYVGLLLIVLAIILFIAEIKIVSHGILSVGGIIAMILGGFMLIDSPEPYLRVSLPVLVVAALLMGGFFWVVVGTAVRTLRGKPTTGQEGLIGEVGVARTRLAPEGQVFVHGELWQARCDGAAEAGEEVRVTAVEGLRLVVETVRAEAPGATRSA
jgi:membrane-bound serine protease (ClpP class)